jgi:hypothetical protein
MHKHKDILVTFENRSQKNHRFDWLEKVDANIPAIITVNGNVETNCPARPPRDAEDSFVHGHGRHTDASTQKKEKNGTGHRSEATVASSTPSFHE